jgi:hypothetical protein
MASEPPTVPLAGWPVLPGFPTVVPSTGTDFQVFVVVPVGN